VLIRESSSRARSFKELRICDEKLVTRWFPAERTYSFGVEDLLYEGYAVGGSLAAPRASVSEDIPVFEREGYRLLLNESWTREAEVCEGAEDERGKEIREGQECVKLGLCHRSLQTRVWK
jgi:hypothetical protein